LINNKLNELETEEKQTQAAIFKQQIVINQTREDLLPIAEVKKLFVSYRAEYPFSDSHTHRMQLTKLIDRIDCRKDALEIQFTMIPGKEKFDI